MTAPHPTTPLTLTVPEAAQRLGRSRDFIRRLIADHQVAATKHRGRWYLNTQSLEQWVQMGAINPTAPDPQAFHPAGLNQQTGDTK